MIVFLNCLIVFIIMLYLIGVLVTICIATEERHYILKLIKANTILTETLTDKVLKKQLIDKWNGEMPKVVGKDNVLLNIE